MALVGDTQLQPVNFLESYARGLELGAARQGLEQEQLQRIKAAEQERTLNELYAQSMGAGGQVDPNALMRGMAQRGLGAQIPAFQAQQEEILSKRATRRKTEADIAAAETDRQIKNATTIADMLGVAKDQNSWAQLRSQAQAAGLDVSSVPETFDPIYRDTMRDGFMGYGKFLENQRTNRQIAVQEGQLTQSRARLAFDKDVESWRRQNPEIEIRDTGQGLLAINKRTGAVKPIIYNGQVITGAAKSVDPRVDEQNTAFNAKRVLNSAQRIANVIQRNSGAMSAGALEAAARGLPLIGEGAAAMIRSEDRQIVEQNYEGIVDALLFMATGAAYNKEQREATINEIKPLFTDKAAALADKRGKLAEYIEAAKIKSGRAWTPELDAAMNVVLGMYGTPDAAAGGAAPAGVDPAVWAAMTPDERALWQRK